MLGEGRKEIILPGALAKGYWPVPGRSEVSFDCPEKSEWSEPEVWGKPCPRSVVLKVCFLAGIFQITGNVLNMQLHSPLPDLLNRMLLG